jgi:hypothetical protein
LQGSSTIRGKEKARRLANQIVRQTPLCVAIKTYAPQEMKLVALIFCLTSIVLGLFFKSFSDEFYIFLTTLVVINIVLVINAAKTTTYVVDKSQGFLLVRKHFLISIVKSYPISSIKNLVQIGVYASRGACIAIPYVVLKSGKRIQLDYWLEKGSIVMMNAYLM